MLFKTIIYNLISLSTFVLVSWLFVYILHRERTYRKQPSIYFRSSVVVRGEIDARSGKGQFVGYSPEVVANFYLRAVILLCLEFIQYISGAGYYFA